MAAILGPKIVRTGLLLELDAADINSYIGTGTNWRDMVGNYHGALTNGPTFSSANGGNIIFDGTNDYVDLANTGTNFQFTNTIFTVSLWIKTNSSTNAVIVSKGGTPSTAGWLFQFEPTGVLVVTTKDSIGNNVYNRISGLTVNNNIWRNIIAIYKTSTVTVANNTISIYIDGNLSNGTGTLGSTVYATTADTVQIARRPSGNYWTGSIANVQIYNRELTASEILQNYNAVKSRFGL